MSEQQSVGKDRLESVDLFKGGKSAKFAPLSVWSMPVLFTSKAGASGKNGTEKQEYIERSYLLRSAVSNQAEAKKVVEMRLTERTSFDLDKVSFMISILLVW